MTTSDGITSEDWNVVQEQVEMLVATDLLDTGREAASEQLLNVLKQMEEKYGRVPSLVATRADFTSDREEELQLLKEAYVTSCENSDLVNLSYVSSSLADYYVGGARFQDSSQVLDIKKASYWLERLEKHMEAFQDDYLKSTYAEVRELIDSSIAK